MLVGKLQDVFDGWDAFAGKLAAEPRACVEPAQFSQRHIVNRALAVGGSIHRGIMNSHQPRVARQLQVCLDEPGTQGNGASKRRKSILRRVARSSSVSNR